MKRLLFGGMLIAVASTISVGPASAIIVDLTGVGFSGSIGDAFFQQISPDPTGTGYIDPFLRIQANNVEKGVNSDGPYTMDEKTGIWTHSVLVSNFGHVMNNGVESIRFMLDINESSGQRDRYLGLDMLEIFVADSKNYNNLADLNANGTLLYDMDNAGFGDSAVHMDYSLNSGSGSGDMFAYLPASLFSGHDTQYLYLFSEFGGEGPPWDSNDGFEEWTNIDSAVPPPIPEPTTLILLGGGLLGAGMIRRRRS